MQFLTSYWRNRPFFHLDRQRFLAERKWEIWLGCLLYIVVLIIRSWENFSHPGLYVEDATYYFKLNYGELFRFENIFRNPNGYFNIFNNFAAQLIAQFDVRLQPLLYQTVASTLSVTTICLFARSGLVRNRYLLIITPLLLGLSGLNHLFYYVTITFQMYLLVLTLILVLLWDHQHSRAMAVVHFLLIPLLVFSGPYSVLAVPFCILFVFFLRGKSWLMGWTILVCLVFLGTTTGSTGSTLELHNVTYHFFQKLWFDTIIEQVFMMGLHDHANSDKLLLFSLLIGISLFIIRSDRVHLRILLLLLVVIILTPAPLLLSNKYLLYQAVFPCHVLTAQFCWLLFVLIILDRILLKLKQQARPLFAAVCSMLLVSFIIVDNRAHTDKHSYEVLYNTKNFLEKIKEVEALELKKQNKFAVITAEGNHIFNPNIVVGSKSPDAIKHGGYYIPPVSKEHAETTPE